MMNKIEKLIDKFCPNGVEFKALSDIVNIKNGYSFKSSKYSDNGIRVIRISDVQKGKISDNNLKFYPINLKKNIKDYLLHENDLLMSLTGNVGRVAMLSKKDLPAGLNQRVACIRVNPPSYITTRFLFHFFNQECFETDALNFSTGAGQKNISTKWLSNYIIPIPPPKVQKEIVKILDNFMKLKIELEAELETRKKQYEYYSDELLTFGDDVEFKELGDIGNLYGGLTGKNKSDFSNGNAKYITYMNIYSNIVVNTDINNFVKIDIKEKQKKIRYGDVLFTRLSETLNECGISSVLTKKINEPLYLNSFCFGFRLNDISLFLPDFLKHIFRDTRIRNLILKAANGVTRFNISKKRFIKIKIPIPPLKVQKRIVKILDDFMKLKVELKMEINIREKQYKHYRNQLLTFTKK